MPLYEYECSSCGRRFEVIQKFADEPVKACTHCGGPVNRLLSSPAVHFKGTGWTVTDYARKSSPADASPSDGEGKKSKEEEKPSAVPSEAAKETKASGESPSKTPSP